MKTKKINHRTAAKLLDVTPQRVSQYIADGRLVACDCDCGQKLLSLTAVVAFKKIRRKAGRPKNAS